MSERPRLFTVRGLFDVVAIVGSILLAFAIDAAWESAREDRQAEELLISLRVEFQAERAEVSRHGERWAEVRAATSSISTAAPSGSPATATVVRAGYGAANTDSYAAFISAKSSMSVR